MNKTNTGSWKNPNANISFHKLNSEIKQKPDSSIHIFHRRPFSQPWYRDLGNLGSPIQNLRFTPEERLGPSLGYHVFDVYRFHIDSLNYYNTTRPYSAFTFQLGSKLEQMAGILHTQNITPYWNFSFDYRKITSPGYYNIQRTNHDNLAFSTNYSSRDQHYTLYSGFVYNKQQLDENGGITNPRELDSIDFTNRKTVDVAFANPAYSTTRSSVTNMQREFSFVLQHAYTWGIADTTYNTDSTQYTPELIPRFRITHRLQITTEKYQFKDLSPATDRYADLFVQSFNIGDSVFMQQKWFKVDNRFFLSGIFGNIGREIDFNAGIGNSIDAFTTYFDTGISRTNIVSNYLFTELKKEPLRPGQWFYQGNAQVYFTGDAAGDFVLNAFGGKDLNKNYGKIVAGFKQQLNSAPYNYLLYQNQYYKDTNGYSKESISQAYVQVESPLLRAAAGAKFYFIGNYIFIDALQQFNQYSQTFNITQFWLRKMFSIGRFYLDNELVYQQLPDDAPVNIPALLGRHQLSYEAGLFNNNLRMATGVELRYHTAYYTAGYSPFFNRFFYQNAYYLGNKPEVSIFFNFRIKRFRAYIMGDQLQQIFTTNTITAPGYPAQNAMLRFGFNWVMLN